MIYLRAICCMGYGMLLRQEYQGIKIRNEEVWGSAIAEMSRLGYIVLGEKKDDLEPWMLEELVFRTQAGQTLSHMGARSKNARTVP